MRHKKSWNRVLCSLLVCSMILPANVLPVNAAEQQQGGTAEVVEIGSDQWETPLIPKEPEKVRGVKETTVNLNETTGNGTWKFLFDIPDFTEEGGVPAPTAEVQDFDFEQWSDKNWQNIKVPGEPLMQGFDILTNNEYYYQREITVPADYAGNRVLLRFDGVYCNARVWIDGKYIRTHVGGFTTWDCDITEYAKPGETVTLTLGVADLYSNTKGIWNPEGEQINNPSNATEYAHHNIGGILRDVSLVAMPYDYIAHTYVNTDFDENFVNANLEVTAQLGMVSDDAALKIELLDGEEIVVTDEITFENKNSDLGELQKLTNEASVLLEEHKDNLYDSKETAEDGQYSKEAYEAMKKERDEAIEILQENSTLSDAKKISIPVTEPKQWDAEHPNLYTLRTTLLVDGEEVQVNEERIGFREIHYGGRDGTDVNKVYVNGKEVKLRGTCRHDVSEDLGRSMTREEAYAEVKAYKNANINHIRTSHYPASEDLLDACDEYGIYVEQETAVCFQGPWSDVYSKYEDFLPQFTEMIERDRNRPSILIWSLGNESNYDRVASQSGGNAFQVERDYLADVDTTRPCIFSFPDTGEPAGFADIYSVHYANVTGGMGRTDKPVLHDEYAHIPCYNLDELQRDVNVRNFWGESVKKAWENIFTTDGALGGALWGGIDDVFYIPEGTTERWQSHSDGQTAGYGEWGSVLDAYLREKPEAYLTKKAYSPVRVDEDACYTAEGAFYIPVKNWFDHTNMNELKLVWEANDGSNGEIQIAESILPHEEGILTVSGIGQDVDTVNLKFYTPDGIMVDEYNVELGDIQYSFAPARGKLPKLTEGEKTVTIENSEEDSATPFSIIFDRETGLIQEAKYKDTVLVTGGPYLHVTGMGLGDWKLDENGFSATEDNENGLVQVVINGTYGNGQKVRFDISISGNGIMETQYTLTSAPAAGSGLKEVGISYDIPGDKVESVSWERDGLYSAYPEDHIGRNSGTALKVRENAETQPDQYGVTPSWPWKDDMMNYFVYATNDPNNGLVTNDFKTMREHIWYYNVNFGSGENAPRISVEDPEAKAAVRTSVTYDLGYVDDRDGNIKYEGGWATYDSSSDYAGTETYSTALGATCEYKFTGTGIRYIGSKQNNVGKVKVYIDEEFKEEIDTYSNLGSALKQSVIYSIEDLEYGEHTIKLETSGGKANCIVVDAFEVLGNGDQGKEEAQLIINNQWYYPNLGWGNYTGIAGTLSNGMSDSVTVRLTDQDNFTKGVIPSVSNVKIAEEEGTPGTLKVTYELRNETDDTTVEYQWYRVAVGDPDSKAQAIDGATEETLKMDGLEANQVFCEVTPKTTEMTGTAVKSNQLPVGEDKYRYIDITADSAEFSFVGTEGTDYKTDKNMSWTANAYEKTVTYLLDTENPASVTYAFTGNGIRWIGAKENNQGIAKVIIDKGTEKEEVKEIDLYTADVTTGNQVNEVLFEKTWEEPGQHTITIERTGNQNEASSAANVSLDAFLLINKNGIGAIAKDVTVTELEDGTLEAGCTIIDGTEADTKYQWYAREAFTQEGYAKEEAEPIDGANQKTYKPALEDAGKLISCEVTPMNGTAPGVPVRSEEVLVGAELVDDTDGRLQYSGETITDTADEAYLEGNKPYGDTITYFDETVSITFNGTGIVWIGGHDQGERTTEAVVDNEEAETVTLTGSADGGWDFNQYKVYEVTGLEAGEHTFTLTNTSGGSKYSHVDAFMILNPDAEPDEELPAEGDETIPDETPEEPGDGQTPGEIPEEPGDGQAPDETPEEPGDGQTPDETPEEPGDGQTPDEIPEEPGDGQTPDETPEEPGDGQTPDETPEEPGDGQTPDETPEEPGDGQTPDETPEEPGDGQTSDEIPEEQPETEETVPSGETQSQAVIVEKRTVLLKTAASGDEIANAEAELSAAIQTFKDSLVTLPGEEPGEEPGEKPEEKPDDKPGSGSGTSDGSNNGQTGGSGGSGSTPTSTDSPKTGDNAPVGLFAGAGVLALVGVVLVLRKRKRG